jgi:hypothetical protein
MGRWFARIAAKARTLYHARSRARATRLPWRREKTPAFSNDPGDPMNADETSPRPLVSFSRATGWVLLVLFVPPAAWLLYEIERTIGLSSPRLWELLRTDRVFDLAMLDFFLTAGWALLVLGDRARWKGWRFWVSLLIFCVVPTLGIILYLLLEPRRSAGEESAQAV